MNVRFFIILLLLLINNDKYAPMGELVKPSPLQGEDCGIVLRWEYL